jgi:hypothetical protein
VLDALDDGDPQVGDRGAGVGEAQLGALDQVAGNAGASRVWPGRPDYGISGAVGG